MIRLLGLSLLAGAIRAVGVVYLPSAGWALSVRYGTTEAAVTAGRSGKLRTWAKLETVAEHLHKLNVVRFDVDASCRIPDDHMVAC